MANLKTMLIAVCNDSINVAWEEIGICYIASYLRQNGYEVSLMQKKEEDIDFSFIEKLNPDIIGFTIYEGSKKSTFNTAFKIKQRLPGVLMCGGGAYPTYCYEELLQEAPFFDFAIRGEGERTFLELLRRIENGENLCGLKGLVYRHSDKIVVNDEQNLIEDLNLLPFPARDILIQNKNKVAMISTSRGCLAKCSFCANQLFWKKWRGRNAKSIVDEIELLMTDFDITLFNFTDASFEDPDKDCTRLRSIAEEIVKRGLKVSYMADFRAEFHKKADDELMKLLVKSGLSGVCIGIESGNEFDLKLYGKVATIEDNIKALELFKEYDIEVLHGFINFNPYSTFERLRKNIEFMERYNFANNIDFVINRYRMFKGARLYDKVKKEGLLVGDTFNETGYQFIDPRVGLFANYISNYIDSIDGEALYALKTITSFAQIFAMYLTQFRRKTQMDNISELSVVVTNFYQRFNVLRSDISATVCSWFRELLSLAESQWDDISADLISDRLLSKDSIKAFAEKFTILLKEGYSEMLRIDKKYAEELISFIYYRNE